MNNLLNQLVQLIQMTCKKNMGKKCKLTWNNEWIWMCVLANK